VFSLVPYRVPHRFRP